VVDASTHPPLSRSPFPAREGFKETDKSKFEGEKSNCFGFEIAFVQLFLKNLRKNEKITKNLPKFAITACILALN